MGEDAVNKAITTGKLANTPCKTANLQIHGFVKERSGTHMSVYGSDEQHIKTIIAENPDFNEKIHPAFPYLNAEVIWAVRNEMARTVEDVLARRMRVLFLNANAAISMAPKVATLMAAELNYDKDWENTQVAKFIEVATLYLPRK
jgi:glycerol-3-phosphate dehydrogenase